MFQKLFITISFFLILSSTSITYLYSQDLIYKPNPNLDYVAVNNEIREGEEEGFLKVIEGDNVKISGFGSPNTSIKILYEDKVVESSVDSNGNWFALFTVLGLPKGSYPVYIETGNSGNKEPLITMVVTETEIFVDETEDEQKNIKGNSSNSYIGYIILGILIPIFTAIGWFLGTYSERNRKND
ncbi:hypothetical protein CVU76_02135 [Candidatus Dojkabacteria bacterium HGW-Dojkabacteria-1]|uniref:Bacterial Ig-like domain-containing protein n=1 Tax=Candidatus Dojkabacteria bacterium HGW-Dojkabacteria-1 TaxID=2013761 RepID=A0A2N2F3S4_9BACT|nr:MAG: hypothetical protein CVU76_02135 [Candidatus Dojkabacteria bacterium HGW-Dojkabacteria-1]